MTTQYKKIMVTLDGSTLAAQALSHAQTLAELFKSELILFRAAPRASNLAEVLEDNRSVLHLDDRQEQLVDEANRYLTALIDDLELHQIKTRVVVEVGLPAETIIDYAAGNEIDLIVMSTHGRTGLSRWVYGSVADKVLRGAPCPVFLVRASLP